MRKMILAALMCAGATAPAAAATQIYTLANASLLDGRLLTGSFGFDASTNTYSNLAIRVSALPGLNLPALNFLTAPLNSTATSLSAQLGLNRLNLTFAPLGAPGSSTPLGGSLANLGTFISTPVASGSISAAVNVGAGPEAATWMMMVAGFGVIGGALRRSRSLRATKTSVTFA